MRIFYIDLSCTFNENIIQIRFPDFRSSIYFVTFANENISIPEIVENPEALTILISDDMKLLARNKVHNNCDIQITLISVDE